MKRIFYLALCLLFSFVTIRTHAQQFDWVTGGGTTADNAYLEDNPEATYYMCTDANGNLYTISTIGYGPVYADTFNSQGNNLSAQNFLISSYTCSGAMRWSKLIASSGGECLPYGIVADSAGHVYVAGYLTNGTLYLGNDTSISGLVYENSALIQYDTNGHFNWIRYVGNNTNATYLGQLDFGSTLAVDGTNNVHFINNMKSGVPIMSGVTSQYGEYDLAFNSTGVLLNATRLNMDSIWYVNATTIDPVTNKLYICGQTNQQFVDTFASYAAAFDANRNMDWMDTIVNDAGTLLSVIYDKIGHLYFGGGVSSAFSFNGLPVPAGSSSIIIKTDTSGIPFWVDQAFSTSSAAGIFQITLLPNNLVAGAGVCGGTLTDGTHSFTTPANEGQNPYLTVLDTSGIVFKMQQIHGDGFYDWSRSITSDKVGNVYIGGQVADSIWATNTTGNIPAYHSVGGNTDFFIMKYGVDCNCASMPVANYTDTGAHTAKSFTYTGTTTSIDSVVWDFGDNSATVNSMNSVTHTYDTGSYEACVYAYSACGSDMHCSRVSVTSSEGITNIENLGVSVYPNPAKDELNITTQTAGITYQLMSVTGVFLTSGSLQQGNNTVSLNGFASGVYILEMKGGKGQAKVVRVVKE